MQNERLEQIFADHKIMTMIHPIQFITDTSTLQLVLSPMILSIWTSPVHYLSFNISFQNNPVHY